MRKRNQYQREMEAALNEGANGVSSIMAAESVMA
jgi:hypothetical protein